MDHIKITVLKRSLNYDLVSEYLATSVGPCENFKEGQTYLVTEELSKPNGFCSWAWNDIYKTVVAISRGGNFSQGMFDGWMKDDHSMVTCCTDGIRPVIFLVEREYD